MNRTENRNPMSDLGCMTQRPNWREPEERTLPRTRFRFWIALLAVVLWATFR